MTKEKITSKVQLLRLAKRANTCFRVVYVYVRLCQGQMPHPSLLQSTGQVSNLRHWTCLTCLRTQRMRYLPLYWTLRIFRIHFDPSWT